MVYIYIYTDTMHIYIHKCIYAIPIHNAYTQCVYVRSTREYLCAWCECVVVWNVCGKSAQMHLCFCVHVWCMWVCLLCIFVCTSIRYELCMYDVRAVCGVCIICVGCVCVLVYLYIRHKCLSLW